LLKSSEEKYRSLFNLSPFGIVAIEKNGNTVSLVNKKLEELIGYDATEIKDVQTCCQLVFPNEEYRASVSQKITQLFTHNKDQNKYSEPFEVEIKTKHGSEHTFEITHAFIENFNILVFNDISERKTYVNTLEQQNNILKEISWIQSHVVRAPLARLLGLFDLLKEKDFTLINEDEMFTHINNSMEELDGHIKDISLKAHWVNTQWQGNGIRPYA
jgi:PAS domain S-box-containing protein